MSEAIFVEGLTKSLPMTVRTIHSWSSLSARSAQLQFARVDSWGCRWLYPVCGR